jgi:predicted MPP superfamily phosphohydrolase
MFGTIVSLLIRFAFLFVLDLYAFQAVKTIFPTNVGIILYLIAASLLAPQAKDIPVKYLFLVFSVIIALYVPKILMSFVLLLEDASRLFRYFYHIISPPPITTAGNMISRARFISQMSMLLGIVPFAAIINGVIRTKYNYKVNRIKIPILDLPTQFEGFTITQISDLHTGSYDNLAAVSRGMDMINELKSDLIVFTGDLINFHVSEVEGFQPIYSKLSAKEGVLAVLGNHDYYYREREAGQAEKDAHFEKVTQVHGTYGWKLLRNENHIIEKEGQKLAVIGVENWSKSPYFPRKGEMDKAIQGAEDAAVKVLLSHDPSHWDGEILPKYPSVHLQLSGHTHGFQFGIEIPGFKWSPAKIAYPQWAGLYQKAHQYLYVNRGFGFLGFSGRVGIRPEIAVLELVKA